ncbi:MAG: ZIP family metal transporter [Symbiobacteriaceae bacterium]|nr:ZIP family metal transporter [Symbiobacteriaceae bacterium]
MLMVMYSILAGVGGTTLGGVLTLLFGERNEKIDSWLLSFAGGVMVSIVCFSLVPESLHLAGMINTVAGLVLGFLIIMPLNRLVDIITAKREEQLHLKENLRTNIAIHQTPVELYHISPIIAQDSKTQAPASEDESQNIAPDDNDRSSEGTEKKQSMLRSGILMFLAIALHNIPEGIAIGAAGSHDMQLGLLIAVMLALHNIPEGMAVAAPLLSGGVRKVTVVFLTALAGATTLLGCLLGMVFGTISDLAIAFSLAAAGGAMLYVVFGEMIPQTVIMSRSRSVTLVTLSGIIIGFMLSHI